MTTTGRRGILVLCLLAGGATAVIAGVTGAGIPVSSLAGTLFLVGGGANLVTAWLLHVGRMAPSRRWGASPLGMALQGLAWTMCGLIALVTSIEPRWVGMLIALVPTALLVIGFRVEHAAQQRELPSVG
jgi:hypothetical protein